MDPRTGGQPGSEMASRRPAPLEPNDERERLESVYREHAGFVWRALGRMHVPDETIPDLVQEVFVVVHRRLSEYDGRAAMTSWLYGIARGVASNHRRGLERAQRRLQRANIVPRHPTGPYDRIARTEAERFVSRFVDELEPAHREVFVLVELEGMRCPEVAEALELHLDAVYTRLRRARARFASAVATWRDEQNEREE